MKYLKRKLLGYYDYTVVLTYVGMLFGVTGITLVMKNIFWGAAGCLMAAGICDMFDGTVAGTKERTYAEKQFGIQIDSLSDLICFGVLPGLFVFRLCKEKTIALVIAAGYILCALIRLAYFNVCESERQQTENGARTCYTGLPVTSSALIIPAIYALFSNSYLCLPFLAAEGILFLSPISIKKPKALGKAIIAGIGLFVASMLVLGVIHGT